MAGRALADELGDHRVCATTSSAPALRDQVEEIRLREVEGSAPKKGEMLVPVSTQVSTRIQSAEGKLTSWSRPGDGLKLRCGISA